MLCVCRTQMDCDRSQQKKNVGLEEGMIQSYVIYSWFLKKLRAYSTRCPTNEHNVVVLYS